MTHSATGGTSGQPSGRPPAVLAVSRGEQRVVLWAARRGVLCSVLLYCGPGLMANSSWGLLVSGVAAEPNERSVTRCEACGRARAQSTTP